MASDFLLEGDELVRVVGTSHYQDALAGLTGPTTAEGRVQLDVTAVLVPEPDNPHDPDAIAVHVEDRLVGYLSRDENRRWREVTRTLAEHGHRAACEARIAGRGEGAGTPNLGVFLRLPTPTEARAQVGIRLGQRPSR